VVLMPGARHQTSWQRRGLAAATLQRQYAPRSGARVTGCAQKRRGPALRAWRKQGPALRGCPAKGPALRGLPSQRPACRALVVATPGPAGP